MKFLQKFSLVLIFSSLLSYFSYSQSLTFVNKEEFVQGLTTDIEIISKAEIKNVSSDVLEIKVKMWIQSLHPGHKVGFCWGACIEPTTKDMVSPTSFFLGPDETSQNFFYAYIDPNYREGTTVAKFTFFDVENPDDSISYTVTFSSVLSSVNSFDNFTEYFNISPIPTNNFLKLTTNFESYNNFTVDIYTEQGKKEKSEIFFNKEKYINLENLPSGIYFLVLKKDNNIIGKRKFIISQ